MTFVELILAVLMTTALLFLLIGWMSNLRRTAKVELARTVLAHLDIALARYHRAHDQFPPVERSDTTQAAVVQLLNNERTRPIIESLPESVRRGPGGRNLVDPWGTPLRYLSESDNSEYVKANEGRPIFVSAGPDRDFGDHDRACIGDNLRSDDPDREGFRPLLSLRETAVEK